MKQRSVPPERYFRFGILSAKALKNPPVKQGGKVVSATAQGYLHRLQKEQKTL